ncbi:small ribosomal subunit protein uS17m isoform 1-T1 [Anomaloglossus baeobatrachus]|uniref:small ribosomal subunit protein uS17m isoform X1 n=2 Tax=Anomaloglossus baeobatrachus TaxID=238106 RepID=UPI003F501C75
MCAVFSVGTMSVVRTTVHAKWIVGKVIGTKMRKTAKVRVTRMVLDSYLLKYYNKRKTYFAHDAEQKCTVGDVVLLKALPERRSKHVTHELSEIVFKVGRVVDPLTGKLCAGSKFLESLEDIKVDDLDKHLQDLKISAGISEENTADS